MGKEDSKKRIKGQIGKKEERKKQAKSRLLLAVQPGGFLRALGGGEEAKWIKVVRLVKLQNCLTHYKGSSLKDSRNNFK